MTRTTIMTAAALSTAVWLGALSTAFADAPKRVLAPKPKKCYSGDQVRDSGQTAMLENGKTYMCNNGRWELYVPLEPLAPTKAK